jgi:hypothetical protein
MKLTHRLELKWEILVGELSSLKDAGFRSLPPRTAWWHRR